MRGQARHGAGQASFAVLGHAKARVHVVTFGSYTALVPAHPIEYYKRYDAFIRKR